MVVGRRVRTPWVRVGVGVSALAVSTCLVVWWLHLEPAVPSWSQRFLVGVSVESAPSGWSQVFWVGVSVESARSHWSQLLQLESAWSQVFLVGVSVESALSHWSQPLQLESAWSQQLRSLHAGASWSGMESADPARSGSLRLAPPRSERSCVGAGFVSCEFGYVGPVVTER